jgi:hypothetical protein
VRCSAAFRFPLCALPFASLVAPPPAAGPRAGPDPRQRVAPSGLPCSPPARVLRPDGPSLSRRGSALDPPGPRSPGPAFGSETLNPQLSTINTFCGFLPSRSRWPKRCRALSSRKGDGFSFQLPPRVSRPKVHGLWSMVVPQALNPQLSTINLPDGSPPSTRHSLGSTRRWPQRSVTANAINLIYARARPLLPPSRAPDHRPLTPGPRT